MSVQGEGAHAKGADGARRAKKWLESTTRANATWVNPDPYAVGKLTFDWPHGGQNFSFDLGGVLKYEQFDGQMFLAESKKYDAVADLGVHYVDYLAKCYVAYLDRPAFCDNFMWISWAPPLSSKWSSLSDPGFVRDAVIKHRKLIFDEPDEKNALVRVDMDVCAKVAERLWLIVLSDRQETLVISKEHRGIVEAHVIGASA